MISFKLKKENNNLFTLKSIFKKNRLFKRGFSIIEILIYLAIFTSISILVINSFIVIISSFSTIQTNHNLLDSGSLVMERLSREIRQSKNIDVVNSQINGGEVLQLNSTDNSGTAIKVKFIKEGNNLNLYKNDIIIGNLLVKNIIVDSISFDRISLAKSEGVKIKIVLKDTKSKLLKTENFYNTIILRGGY